MKLKSLKMAGLLACTVGAMVAMPGAAFANLVVNGDFEQPNLGGAPYQTFFAGQTLGAWQVTAGTVDLVSPTYWQGTGQSVDTAGLIGLNGTISQTINAAPGLYFLNFDLSGNPEGAPTIKTLRVTLGAFTQTFNFDTTGHTTANMGWMPIALVVPVGAPNPTLSFSDESGVTYYGAVIDNVSVTQVPEPSTCIAGAMMLLPFGFSALRTLRRKQTA